ncbi:MAG: extracellular solute-binding protein [Oscillatoria sp. PMC 1068.18]|nr:extracellular solute-binding protein [Oscillatoria sp. PMC 1076.18]MEC4988823.1 extracellular solute-binding protein [Oscillatoria sp. PMC 1068.18]
MLNRRTFLLSATATALLPLLSSCSNAPPSLAVRLLKNSLPPQVLGEFRDSLPRRTPLDFQAEELLQDIFRELQKWQNQDKIQTNRNWWQLPNQKKTSLPQLVTLGNYWLTQAIEENLIQPFDNLEKLSGWQNLDSRWHQLVKRNEQGLPDAQGKIWGAPYRWGTTLIAYREDKLKSFDFVPQDWSDLWRKELRDRVSLVDHPREVIGLTLKKLGHSYNTANLGEVPNLQSELLALHQQVKLYSSENYLQPLILGDTWVAVGWSADILALQARYSDIVAVIPNSGTSLWADLWVQPKKASLENSDNDPENLSYQWIDFCWQLKAAIQISLFTRGASPYIISSPRKALPEDILGNPLLLPSEQILTQSEFIEPLPEASQQQYLDLWREIRS